MRDWRAYAIDMQIVSFAQEGAEFAATGACAEAGSPGAIDWIRFNCHLTASPGRPDRGR
ncbi:MAG: hypothetical protein ACYDA0_06980 [Candidatus Dormibacteraceae bacterium]